MGLDKFSYEGKRALIVGGATGMGAATAQLVKQLGAEVIVMDIADIDYEVSQAISLDLRKKDSIENALAQVEGPVHALFSCACVSGEPFSPMDVMLINFIGQRELIESAVEANLVSEGGAIAAIASIGGMGWDRQLSKTRELLDTPDFDNAVAWVDANSELAGYEFSKRAMIAYCGYRAVPFCHKGIRINSTGPGPTVTPLMASTPSWGQFADGEFKRHMGKDGCMPVEQAYPLAFLNSDAASFVSGQSLFIDAGYTAGGVTGAIDSALVNALAPPIA